MECHDVRLLLAFTQRPCESVDDAERAVVVQHLNACPDCAAFAQAERALDDALGQAMRDVAAPADLKPRLLKRLSASRGTGRWKWSAAMAAALLLTLTGGLSWHYHWSRPLVTHEDLKALSDFPNWNEEDLRKYLRSRGIDVVPPPDFNLQYLQHVDIVEFKGKRVAKLTYERRDEPAKAIVLILPNGQFRLHELNDNQASVEIVHSDECTYLIYAPGGTGSLKKPGPV